MTSPSRGILCVGLTCVDLINVVASYPKEDSDNRCLRQRWSRGGNASNNATVLAILNGRLPARLDVGVSNLNEDGNDTKEDPNSGSGQDVVGADCATSPNDGGSANDARTDVDCATNLNGSGSWKDAWTGAACTTNPNGGNSSNDAWTGAKCAIPKGGGSMNDARTGAKCATNPNGGGSMDVRTCANGSTSPSGNGPSNNAQADADCVTGMVVDCLDDARTDNDQSSSANHSYCRVACLSCLSENDVLSRFVIEDMKSYGVDDSFLAFYG